jgi:hypothetical protein
MNDMEKALKQNFLLNPSHIQKIENASSKEFHAALEQIGAQIKKQGVKNANVLIYYVGHGGDAQVSLLSQVFPILDKRSEGRGMGMLAFRDKIYTEPMMKEQLKRLPGDAKITTILDTCSAGSWIA